MASNQVKVRLTATAYGGRPAGTVMTLNKPVADLLLQRGVAEVVTEGEDEKVLHKRPRNKALSAA